MCDPPTYDDVITAATRTAGHANRIPVISSRTFDEELGVEVFFKRENLQRMGALEFCGVFNAPSRFSAEQRATGVMASSSDNHAQAIAFSAHLLGIPATIVMPADAPAVKIEATCSYGGQVVFYDRYMEDHEQIGHDLVQRHGLTLIPPCDHPDVLAGQGTMVKELLEEVGSLDAFFAPLDGGGLFSGCALTIRVLTPAYWICRVEPEAGNDGRRSLRSGAIVYIDTPRTLADGIQTQHLGNPTSPLIQYNVDDILITNDTELVGGICSLITRVELLAELTGCLGLAVARQHKDELRGKQVGTLLSGGNANLVRSCALLSG